MPDPKEQLAEKTFPHVEQITEEDVERFIRKFIQAERDSGELLEAIDECGIKQWPANEWCGCRVAGVLTPCSHQRLCLKAGSQMRDRILERIKPALREAFWLAAEEVLFHAGGSL